MKDERREGFERLCREEYDRVLRTAFLTTGDREQAMDLTPDTFALAYRKWPHVSGIERPGVWSLQPGIYRRFR